MTSLRASIVTTSSERQTSNQCVDCRRVCDSAAFLPSSLKHGIRKCRHCQSAAVTRSRKVSPERWAAHCLYEMERRQTPRGRAGTFSVELVTRVLDRFSRRSIISGDRRDLRLRRFFPDMPFSEWNAAVVTAGENKALSRTGEWRDRFSPSFVANMENARAALMTTTS